MHETLTFIALLKTLWKTCIVTVVFKNWFTHHCIISLYLKYELQDWSLCSSDTESFIHPWDGLGLSKANKNSMHNKIPIFKSKDYIHLNTIWNIIRYYYLQSCRLILFFIFLSCKIQFPNHQSHCLNIDLISATFFSLKKKKDLIQGKEHHPPLIQLLYKYSFKSVYS